MLSSHYGHLSRPEVVDIQCSKLNPVYLLLQPKTSDSRRDLRDDNCAMSTPSTLPPHRPNYGYSHHQNYQSNPSYRANNTLLNGVSRLGGAYNASIPPSTESLSGNLIDHQYQNQMTLTQGRPESTMGTVPAPPESKQPARKRLRSREPREPDWNTFYKNGLPKEVIVIDDSPTPDPSISAISNGQSNHATLAENTRHTTKKRKRDDVYDPVYQVDASNSADQSPQYKTYSSGSTVSTDRTTSAIHTTAATSLGSLSSNGQNGYEVLEDTVPGQKRKRTATRLQIANEAKRKELEVNGDAYTSYRPPPRPPIKAPEVQVKVIQDVSSLAYSRSYLGHVLTK